MSVRKSTVEGRTVFHTSDGKYFYSEAKAQAHEAKHGFGIKPAPHPKAAVRAGVPKQMAVWVREVASALQDHTGSDEEAFILDLFGGNFDTRGRNLNNKDKVLFFSLFDAYDHGNRPPVTAKKRRESVAAAADALMVHAAL
jgi:hypothetical protein